MKRVVLIRHGATAGNLQRRYIGRTDEPLCAQGRQQVLPLAGMLQADRIVVSPLCRARQTAELVFPGQPWEICPDLRETDFGIFEGKTAAELAENEAYTSWVNGGCTAPIPGGEAVTAFKARCCEAFLNVMEQSPVGSTTAFVIHGGCIMAVLEAFAQPNRDFYSWHLPNGGYFAAEMEKTVLRTVVEYPGKV